MKDHPEPKKPNNEKPIHLPGDRKSNPPGYDENNPPTPDRHPHQEDTGTRKG